MSESIRIRTTPNGSDKYLSVKLEQDFDFIEILSLKISQDKAYQNFCSDYGVIVGRVTINNGFGIPNAKVSVFIPIDDNDKQIPQIQGLYPYETVNDKNSDGIRYNLLPKESDSQDDCYTVVGTFPAKREVLDNDEMLYVYCKYYKFNAITNHAGDFMIFGVPLGAHTIHVDADISNIGIASQRPYDLIDQGTPSKMFYSPTKFKDSKNLNSLIQIKTANVGVNVQPFWGDTENCQIGINRADIDLNFSIRPAAIFMGSLFGDSERNSFNKRCRPRKKMGMMCEQIAKEGTIEMIRKTKDNQIEKFDIEGGRLIDSNGAWAYQIPCNLDYVITDEFGTIVPSEDETKGIPTRTRVRFRISMDDGNIADGGLESDDLLGSGGQRVRARYLVPHNPTTSAGSDYTFDGRTGDAHFVDLWWNKIYSVKNFIARVQKQDTFFDSVGGLERVINYTGIKHVDGCIGDKNPFPYNRTYTRNSVLFTIICFIVTLIAFIVYLLNTFLCWIRGIGFSAFGFSWHPFGGIDLIKMKCVVDDVTYYFEVGSCADSIEDYTDCVSIGLALGLDMFEMHFFNDWVNGTLYYPLAKLKARKRGRKKFCEYQCNDNIGGGNAVGTLPPSVGQNDCRGMDLADSTITDVDYSPTIGFRNGMIARFEGKLYYPPIVIDRQNASQYKLFAADIINLGAVLDCDWQGFPKIIQYLSDTSYKAPPLVEEFDAEANIYTTGQIKCGSKWEGLFFTINCLGLHFNNWRANNMRRQCELMVDLAESHSPGEKVTNISIQEIYDVGGYNQPPVPLNVEIQTNLNKFVRDSFTLLNISGAGISAYPPAPYTIDYNPTTGMHVKQNGSSFAINGQNNTEDYSSGAAYHTFRQNVWNYRNDIAFQGLGNSYYFYFGAEPNGTAINKINAKYFTTCIKINPDDFIINSTVTNTSTNGASDGQIQFNVIGGTGPFIYTVVNNTTGTISIGPITNNTLQTTPVVLNNLPAGTYTITVVDALQTSVIKDVEVTGPPPLVCNASATKNACSPTSNDGIADLTLANGIPPYRVTYSSSTGVIRTLPSSQTAVAGTQTLNGFGVATYLFTVTDSSSPQQQCQSQFTVDSPPPLAIKIGPENTGYKNVTCTSTANGYIRTKVSGGTSPYQISVNRDPNNPVNSCYFGGSFSVGPQDWALKSNFDNLYPGVYDITVTDSGRGICQQTATTQVTISKYIPPEIYLTPSIVVSNLKQCDPNQYTISYYASQGTPTCPLDIPTPAPFNTTYSLDGLSTQIAPQSNQGVNTLTINPLILLFIKITITDSRNCSDDITIYQDAFHRPTVALNLSLNSYSTPAGTPQQPNRRVITWNAIADTSWPLFNPLTYTPVDTPGGNTYTTNSSTAVLGTVTNGVNCTATATK
jgi:hypothetical protein